MNPKITRGTKLRWSPYAWSKFLYFLKKGETEIGGYGVTETEDPLLITDFQVISQECTAISVELDEEASKQYAIEMDSKNLEPWMYHNIWCHTHPGNCPEPSGKDEEIFNKYFGKCHWAVFFIKAKGGKEYCRIRFNVGPGTEVLLDSIVDYNIPFKASDFESWKKEYDAKIRVKKFEIVVKDKDNKEKHWSKFVEETKFLRDEIPPDWTRGYDIDLDEEDEFFDDNGIGCYWDTISEEFYYYDPSTDEFYDEHNIELIYNPKSSWMKKLKQWSKENIATEQELVENGVDYDD